jgi:hypothetical protein
VASVDGARRQSFGFVLVAVDDALHPVAARVARRAREELVEQHDAAAREDALGALPHAHRRRAAADGGVAVAQVRRALAPRRAVARAPARKSRNQR